MKIVRAKLAGELTAGDRIMLHGCGAAGGRSTIGATVEADRAELDADGNPIKVKDTVGAVLQRMLLNAGLNFLKDEFKFSLLGTDTLRIECSDVVDKTAFVEEVYGAKTEHFEIEEF
jgi:hypothetical protein